jgi:hypothetical protein
MLFPYHFVPNHTIYTLQKWMDDLFLTVWCVADPAVDYNIDLLPDDLKAVVMEIFNDAKVTTDYLYGPIEKVYKIFQSFDQPTKDTLALAYRHNNSVEDLCKQTNGCNPFLYSALTVVHEDLGVELKRFYKALFTDVIGLKAVRDRIGHIDSHYDDFVTLNDESKCPFCGINGIKGRYVSKRDAYDHFLPKGIYPFNSINFKNLSPMCYDCNSSYKGAKDLLHRNAVRRKAFYPFDAAAVPNIQLSIAFSKADISTLTPADITLTLTSAGQQDEVDSWKDVFGIEERYKAKCLEKNDGLYWFEQATEEFANVQVDLGEGFTKDQWVQQLINSAKRKPYAAGNFIKAKYLEACRNVGAL